jgi:O-antigen/teichoic acid export membrane protein
MNSVMNIGTGMINLFSLLHIDFKRYRKVSKEIFWVIFGQIISVVGSLLGLRLLTKFLSPGSYGELALELTLATLVSQTVMGPLSNGVTRFYAPAFEQNDLHGYIMAVKRLALSVSRVIVILMLIIIAALIMLERVALVCVAVMIFVFAVLTGYNLILNGIQNAARQRIIVALHQGVGAWMRFLVPVFLLTWEPATSSTVIVGYNIAAAVMLGSQYVFFRKFVFRQTVKSTTTGNNWKKQIWQYSWPFATWGVFTWAQISSDRWALDVFTSVKEVGRYAVLFQLGYNPVTMAMGMVIQLLEPIFFQQVGNANDNRRNNNVKALNQCLTIFVLMMTGIGFVVTRCFHEQIFHIFVPEEYMSISYLLPWVVLSGGIFAAGQTIALNLMCQKRTLSMAVVKIVTAFLGIIFNFIGAYWCGTRGIVIANFLFSILYFIFMEVLSINIIRQA